MCDEVAIVATDVAMHNLVTTSLFISIYRGSRSKVKGYLPHVTVFNCPGIGFSSMTIV